MKERQTFKKLLIAKEFFWIQNKINPVIRPFWSSILRASAKFSIRDVHAKQK